MRKYPLSANRVVVPIVGGKEIVITKDDKHPHHRAVTYTAHLPDGTMIHRSATMTMLSEATIDVEGMLIDQLIDEAVKVLNPPTKGLLASTLDAYIGGITVEDLFSRVNPASTARPRPKNMNRAKGEWTL